MLQLDDTYRVLLDSSQQNFTLEKFTEITDRQTKEVKYSWLNTGFHGLSLRSVLHSYAKQKIADGVNEVPTADLLISKINELESTINKISKEIVFEVVSKEKKTDE